MYWYHLTTLNSSLPYTLYSIGRPKHKRVMAGALEGDTFVGNRAQKHRGLLSLKYPMEHGIVDNWADMEQIWAYLYSAEELQTRSEEVGHAMSSI